MGAPKQKWTAEEEAALKAGVHRHGAGKWQTILRDPEFGNILRSRSNVDLKDKWRNINVTASGLGSREKARLALKKNPHTPSKHDDKHSSFKILFRGEERNDESNLPALSNDKVPAADSKRNFNRLDGVILEAISNLKDYRGSNKNAIASYIEEKYWEPPNFIKLLSSKLKFMTTSGKLIKVKHRYKIASSESRTCHMSDANQKEPPKPEQNGVAILTRTQVEDELEKMRSMSACKAAATAAQLVAEAEAALAAAEKAAREAEAAEAEAEEAQAFAVAAAEAAKCHRLCAS